MMTKMMIVMMMIFLIMCLADVQRLRGLAGSHHKAQVHDQVSFIPGHHHYVYDDYVEDDCINSVTFPSGKLFLDQFLGLFLLNSQEFSGIK